MNIRRATENDIKGVGRLLFQVQELHHTGRPDLFRAGAKKYTDAELASLFQEEKTPVFVAADEEGHILGYAFCILLQQTDSHILTNIRTLYIDDLCVDEACRGQHIGKALYQHVLSYAKEKGCYNVTLNVWACNESAIKFYEKCGLVPQKIGMEKIL